MTDPAPLHPYYPTSVLIPNYTNPTRSTFEFLFQFGNFVVVILAVSFYVIRKKIPSNLSRQLIFMWFVICGCIHGIIEGWWVYNHKDIAGQSYLLSECWKEYSYSDSRYLTNDSFVVVMETITTVAWGPLSFLVAYYIYTSNPTRHILAFLVSTGQLYGDVLYFATALVEGAPHTAPNPVYFWFYFVGFNIPWIIVPLIVMWSSAKEINKSFASNQVNKKRN